MVIPANPLLTKTTRIDVANRPPNFFDTILFLPELPRGPQRSQLTGVVPRFHGRQLRFDLPGSNGVTPITTFLTSVHSNSLTKQGSASVFQEKDQMKFVGGALLQFGNEVKVEVAGHGALRVDQESSATNVITDR